MAKEFSKAFYKSSKWQKCRASYIDERILIDGGLCEICRKQLGYIVHHKIALTPENIEDDSFTLAYDNLCFECKECHDREEEHAFIKVRKLNCFFDENGQPIVPPP